MMEIAKCNAEIRALLAKQQQLLQQQMHQLLDQHTAAIAATLEGNCHSKFMQPNPMIERHPASTVVASVTSEEAAAAAAAAGFAMQTSRESIDTVHSSSASRGLGHNMAPKQRSGYIAGLTQDTVGPSTSMRQKISQFMQGRIATGAVAFVIMANTVIMYVQLQWLGNSASASLGLDNHLDSWGPAEEVFRAFDLGFAIFFLVEFLLNMSAFGCEYFVQPFNVIDTSIVLITSVEALVLQTLFHDEGNISFLRILRLAKFTRALRVVRTMTLFSKLRILLTAVVCSLGALFWSMVLMFLMMLMGTIFLCQMLHDFVIDEGADLTTRIWVNDRFGSGNKALYTFFEMTFSGGWPNSASRVVKEVSPYYVIFFALYVTFVVFGLIRIISALILSETLQQANRDSEIMVHKHAKKEKRLTRELEELFDVADTSGEGLLSFDELDALLAHHKVQHWLAELGINATDTHLLFELLLDDGHIDKPAFVGGLTKLKGEARAQDLLSVSINCQRILAQCKVMRQTVVAMAASADAAAPQPLSLHQSERMAF